MLRFFLALALLCGRQALVIDISLASLDGEAYRSVNIEIPDGADPPVAAGEICARLSADTAIPAECERMVASTIRDRLYHGTNVYTLQL